MKDNKTKATTKNKNRQARIFKKYDDLFFCSRCGSCLAFCPAYKNTLDESVAPRGKLNLIEAVSRGKLDFTEKLSEKIYTCTLCNYCNSECPSGVKISELFEAMREDLVDEEKYPQALNILKSRISTGRNVTFETNEGRADWMNQLSDFKPEDYLKEKAEVIYFVGCVSSFSPRTFSIPRAMVRILKKAEVDFSLLGDSEWCCGFPLISSGIKEMSSDLADHNIRMVKEKGAKILIASCASCYHTWKHEYPKFAKEKIDFEILHISQYLLKLIKEGKLRLNPMNLRITYHDPCDLGRNSGIYEEPREVIKSIPGVTFVELPGSRNLSNCCGGGGNLESINSDLASKIALSRADEVISTGVDVIVSSCQQCERTISAALKKKKKEMSGQIKVWDISELILKNLENTEI